MKKIFFIVAITFASLSFVSCQRAKNEEKNVTQAQNEESQKTVIRQNQQTMTETQRIEALDAELKKSTLTENEQKEFEKIGGGGIPSPNLFKNKKDALTYLNILLKGNEKTIRWYVNYAKNDDVIKGKYKTPSRQYGDDICTAVDAIALKREEAFDLIIEVMKKKSDYSTAHACACKKLGWYTMNEGKTERVKSAISILKEAAKNRDPNVRLEAAGALLAVDEADIALPVLDELAKEGYGEALAKLFKPNKDGIVEWSALTFWDARGLDIIKKALDYPSDEVKSWTAIALVSLNIDKAKVEEVALNIVKKYMFKTKKDYGYETIGGPSSPKDVLLPGYEGKDIWELEKRETSDTWACWNSIAALGRLKSKAAIPYLKTIKENNTEPENVCWETRSGYAAWALEQISGTGGGK